MAGLGRWAGFVLGLVIVSATFSSVVGTIVLPKGVRSRISYTVWRAIHQPFMAVAGRMRRYESKDRLLGLHGPVSLLALLGAWLLLFLLGYALLFLPLTGDGSWSPRLKYLVTSRAMLMSILLSSANCPIAASRLAP